MPPGRSSDSLRAVLLSAKSHSGSGSKPGSSAVTWQSLRSVGATGNSDPPGHYFPAKLALALGLVKIFFGFVMIGLGTVAIVMKASISSIGAGVWVGVIVGISGFLGVCAAKRPYIHVYVISFLSVSILTVAASGLLIVLSATAWARDNQMPQIILYDKETRSEVDLFGEFLIRRPSILVSGLLVVLGVFDILTSLACVALSAREACGTSSQMGVFTNHDGHDKKERLYRWLGQQKTIFQAPPPVGSKNISSVSQFVPVTLSAESSPLGKTAPSLLSPSVEPLLQGRQRRAKKLPDSSGKARTSTGNISEVITEKKRSQVKVSGGVSPHKKNSSVVFLHPEADYELKQPVLIKMKEKTKCIPTKDPHSLPPLVPLARHVPCPRDGHYVRHWGKAPALYTPIYHNEMYVQNSDRHQFYSLPSQQHQLYAQYPTMFYPAVKQPQVTYYSPLQSFSASRSIHESNKQQRTEKKREKRRKSKEEKMHSKAKKKEKSLTDQQIENTYTGLDREIAEGFISLAMEPAASRRKSHHSFSEPESF